MPEINGIMLPFMPAGGVKELEKSSNVPSRTTRSVSFDDIFKKELNRLKFSGHAQSRMQSREIVLSDKDIDRLENAVSKADEKGARESLVLMDEKAFIVSVPNKTVITVVGKDMMDSNVITNIDSAVFA